MKISSIQQTLLNTVLTPKFKLTEIFLNEQIYSLPGSKFRPKFFYHIGEKKTQKRRDYVKK